MAAAPAQAQAPLASCKVTNVTRDAQCGTISVPEDRAQPQGRRIALSVVVLKAPAPASTAADAAPLLFFAGGPGQGAALLAQNVAGELIAAAPTRDIVFIDQRGTGKSNPLMCPGGFGVLETPRLRELSACRETLAQVANLEHYGTDETADDAADVVRALGYAQVHLFGVSYGTRLAQHFAARHPALVRTVVLRAMAPPGFNILLDGGRSARAAFDRLIADCAADAECAKAFPALRTEIETMRQLLRQPGMPLSTDLFDLTMYALMLTTETRQLVPWLAHSAATGSLLPFGAAVQQVQAVYDSVALGAYLSVVCAEDVPRLTAADRRELENGFSAASHMVVAACDRWDVAPAAAAAPLPRVPLLVLSGDVDPAMPAASVDRALQGVTTARHIVLPATAHGPTLPGCSADLVKQFMDSNGQAMLNAECLKQLTLPAFRIN